MKNKILKTISLALALSMFAGSTCFAAEPESWNVLWEPSNYQSSNEMRTVTETNISYNELLAQTDVNAAKPIKITKTETDFVDDYNYTEDEVVRLYKYGPVDYNDWNTIYYEVLKSYSFFTELTGYGIQPIPSRNDDKIINVRKSVITDQYYMRDYFMEYLGKKKTSINDVVVETDYVFSYNYKDFMLCDLLTSVKLPQVEVKSFEFKNGEKLSCITITEIKTVNYLNNEMITSTVYSQLLTDSNGMQYVDYNDRIHIPIMEAVTKIQSGQLKKINTHVYYRDGFGHKDFMRQETSDEWVILN